MDVEDRAVEVQRLINVYGDAAQDHARLAKKESDLEADRCTAKSAAILRILSGTNPLNGKPHSASSAEAIVESDPEYRAYLATQGETVFAKNMAWAAMESLKMRAHLAMTLLETMVAL